MSTPSAVWSTATLGLGVKLPMKAFTCSPRKSKCWQISTNSRESQSFAMAFRGHRGNRRTGRGPLGWGISTPKVPPSKWSTHFQQVNPIRRLLTFSFQMSNPVPCGAEGKHRLRWSSLGWNESKGKKHRGERRPSQSWGLPPGALIHSLQSQKANLHMSPWKQVNLLNLFNKPKQ